MEESQSNPRRSRRIASQPSLTPDKPLRAKRTRLTRSKSPTVVRTSVPTTSETLVTPTISGNPAFTEEVLQLPRDSDTDPSLRVDTCLTEPVISLTSPESVVPQTSVAVDFIPSSAPEIFYGPDGLPLPPGLIAIEEIAEDLPSSAPLQFGAGITLYPSTSEVSLPQTEVHVESIGSILDRLKMSEQPSTSRTVSSDTATAELPAVTPTMFDGVPAVPTSSQQLEGAPQGAFSTVWSVPVCLPGIAPGNPCVGTQGQLIPVSVGLPYGGQYAFVPSGGLPYGNPQQNIGSAGIVSSGWMPTLPQRPNVVYSMQQSVPMYNIPTTPAIVTVSQVQTLPVVSQPQVTQVLMQQPFELTTQPQSPTGGITQVQTGTITPHFGQAVSIGQQPMASQPWLVQYQQPQFQQVYQGSEQQIFANSGQPYIQSGQNYPFYGNHVHQPYQGYQHPELCWYAKTDSSGDSIISWVCFAKP